MGLVLISALVATTIQRLSLPSVTTSQAQSAQLVAMTKLTVAPATATKQVSQLSSGRYSTSSTDF